MAMNVASSSRGGGRRSRRKPVMAEINVTPMVDVMLVLLIIFMVSAPLATLAIKVDLPPTQESKVIPKNPTYISITKTGIYVVGEPTTLDQLGGVLTRHFNVANPQQETVMIRADRDVKYEAFMSVVNQLQTDGYYKVGLIAENLGTS